MLYASINSVYTLVKAVANVNQRGFISPSNINAFSAQAQLEVFHETLHEYKMAMADRQRYLSSYKSAYNSIQSIEDDLKPLLRVSVTLSSILSSNEFATPNDFAYFLSLTARDVEASIVSPESISFSRRSFLSLPSEFNPTAYFTVDKVVVYPESIISNVKLSYYKTPKGVDVSTGLASESMPTYGYNVINGSEIYNPSSSIDFELPKHLENKIASKILSYVGISLSMNDIVQFAELQQQKETANG
jgi:hypothetical protein